MNKSGDEHGQGRDVRAAGAMRAAAHFSMVFILMRPNMVTGRIRKSSQPSSSELKMSRFSKKSCSARVKLLASLHDKRARSRREKKRGNAPGSKTCFRTWKETKGRHRSCAVSHRLRATCCLWGLCVAPLKLTDDWSVGDR